MRIKKLENCPDWLLEAKVGNEDVEINECGIVIWKGGIWEDGIWKGGIWKGGIWEGGIWKDGIWEDGIWEGGRWEGGRWEDGIWKGGRCKWNVFINSNRQTIHIGCKEKSVEDWDEWFKSNDTYETNRDTEQFKRIYNAYLVARFRLELEF